jgi:hypothetical protein
MVNTPMPTGHALIMSGVLIGLAVLIWYTGRYGIPFRGSRFYGNTDGPYIAAGLGSLGLLIAVSEIFL